MKTEWLEDFLALTEEGNFSRAAHRRNQAQPAFSRRIKSLEDWAGSALFDRDQQPILLTEAGRLLRPMAEEVSRTVRQNEENLRQLARGAKTLRFSATHTLSILFFPEWFHSVQEEPEESSVNLSLEANHMDTCAQSISEGTCHFMMCFTHDDADLRFDQSRHDSKLVGQDTLVPVSAPDRMGNPSHRLPGTRKKSVRYLAYSNASALRQIVEAMLTRRNLSTDALRISVESPVAGALKSMAEENQGVAWIPQMRIRKTESKKPLVPAGGEEWWVPVDIRIFKARGPLPKCAEVFWNSIPDLA